MSQSKNLEKLQRIVEFSQSSIFEEIINRRLRNDALAGLLIHGSFINSEFPNDMDVLIVSKIGKRHFKTILNLEIPIEIEYVPKDLLYLPLTNFHWYTQNWEYEIAKYVYGNIIYDPLNQLQKFIAKAGEYPLEIAQYLFLHRAGRCRYILRKIKKHDSINCGYIASLIDMFILTCLAVERKIPMNLNSFDSLSEGHKNMIEQAYFSIEPFEGLLNDVTKEASELLELDRLFEKRENSFRFWYLAEVEGLHLTLENCKIPYSWPEVIRLEDL